MYVWVLDVGDVEYGVSVYLVVFELDVGVVLVQVWVLVMFGDDVDSLVVCVLEVEYFLLIVIFQLLCGGCLIEWEGQLYLDGYFLFSLLVLDFVGNLNW